MGVGPLCRAEEIAALSEHFELLGPEMIEELPHEPWIESTGRVLAA